MSKNTLDCLFNHSPNQSNPNKLIIQTMTQNVCYTVGWGVQSAPSSSCLTTLTCFIKKGTKTNVDICS